MLNATYQIEESYGMISARLVQTSVARGWWEATSIQFVEPSEKIGGREACYQSMTDFRTMIDSCGLVDAGFSGNKYT
jgi:hypothetical protein